MIAVSALILMSCESTQTLYSWHGYDKVTYKYSKKPTKDLQVKMLTQYDKLIKKQKGTRGVVPPGLYAEYGFLLYKTGRKKAAVSFLNKEVELYPESEQYISRIIKQLEK